VHLSFFIGKGGVGKTTVSSAFAVHRARSRPRESVLLISTDPAHSLADIFEIPFADSPRRIPTQKGKLFGWQIHAEKLFDRFLGEHRDEIFRLLESGTLFTRHEIEPLLSANLPGMAEMAALIAMQELLRSKRYDRIVIDTAPLGHTLRFFEMPGHFLRFLDFLDVAGSRDAVLAATFGGKSRISHAFLDKWRTLVTEIENAFRPAEGQPQSELVLVTTAENFALQEGLRARDALARDRLQISKIVLNRVVSKDHTRASQRCRRCLRSAKAAQQAEGFLKKHFPDCEIVHGEDTGAPILGTKDLAAYGAHLFEGRRFTPSRRPPADGQHLEMRLRRSRWPVFDVPLALTLGKGGVGKTTISAALAFAERLGSRQKQVTICSTDPAPSLDDVFRQKIGDQLAPVHGDAGLLAAEFDSVAEFERWSARMKSLVESAFSAEAGGLHVDLSFERRLFSALLDIVPPGVDEILSVFRILDLLPPSAGETTDSRKQRSIVILDMAPTGHSLELLRMPDRMLHWSRLLLKALAQHRHLPLAQDAAVEIAGVSQRVRELARMLRNGRQSLVVPVMLAEPLPDRETAQLLASLKQLGICTSPVFVNRILFERDVKDCVRCQRARAWQMATLSRLEERLGAGQSLWIVRNFPGEVAGPVRLQSFVRELWQLQRGTKAREKRRQKRAAEGS
jgi:arsenite-transporting ATPase